jgi:hypothetical protein
MSSINNNLIFNLNKVQRESLSEFLNCGIKNFESISWVQDVSEHFPEKNNHNTPYYGVNKIYKETFKSWLKNSEQVLKENIKFFNNFENNFNVIVVKSKKCAKCNRKFKDGNYGCFIYCACIIQKKTIKIQCCIRCVFLNWIIKGSLTNDQGKSSLYKSDFSTHPGYTKCKQCDHAITLNDFYKIKLLE